MIDRFLQADFQEGREEPADDQLFAQMAGRLAIRSRGRINSLLDWIRNFVNAPEIRIEGARQHAVAAQQLLQMLHENALTQAAELHKSVIEIGMTAQSDEMYCTERARFVGWSLRRRKPDDKLHECLISYSETCLNELLHRAVAKVVRMVVLEVSLLIEQLDRLSRDLNQVAGSSQRPSPAGQTAPEADENLSDGSPPELAAYRQLLREQLRIRRQDIAHQIETVIAQQLSTNGQDLRTFLDSEAELQRLLGRPLDGASRQAVLACIQEINAQLVSACGAESECQAMRHLGESIVARLAPAAENRPANFAERILIIPDEADPAKLRARLGCQSHTASIVQGRKCDITLCSARRLDSLETAANEIIDGIPVYKELANRLHTRVDLTWRPFLRASDASDAAQHDAEQPAGPMQTVVLDRPQVDAALAPAGALACADVVPGGF
jgi:hypothetical protein